ncbi:MAG: hypothetical protein ACTSUU_06795 [Candidatus Thorarchaeota archaeon]
MSRQLDTARVREDLAEYAHVAWSGWMSYLFGKSEKNRDETITIPKWAAKRWARQAATHYADLPDKEKESDRLEADKMLAIMSPDPPSCRGCADRDELLHEVGSLRDNYITGLLGESFDNILARHDELTGGKRDGDKKRLLPRHGN